MAEKIGKVGQIQKGGTPDRVWIQKGMTLNLGNYESFRLDIGMASDTLRGETKGKALERVEAFIDKEFERAMKQTKKQLKERS